MCILKYQTTAWNFFQNELLTNALSFYRSQNVLEWSIFFEPDQKFIYILWQSQKFLATQKDDFHSVKLLFCRHKRFWRATKCNQSFGLAQKIWTGTKHCGTCKRARQKNLFCFDEKIQFSENQIKFCGTYTCAYVIYEWYFRPPSQGCTRDDLPSISLKWILSVLSFLQFRKYAKTTSLSLICRSLIQSVISKLSISSCWASKNSKIALLFNFFPFWCRPNLNDCKESTVRKFSCFSHIGRLFRNET